MGLLTGKTALVTGAARGIGKAVAMKFAQEGANIAFTDLVLNDDMAAGLEARDSAASHLTQASYFISYFHCVSVFYCRYKVTQSYRNMRNYLLYLSF